MCSVCVFFVTLSSHPLLDLSFQPAFEDLTREKQRNNPKFSFLFHGGAWADHYRETLRQEIIKLPPDQQFRPSGEANNLLFVSIEVYIYSETERLDLYYCVIASVCVHRDHLTRVLRVPLCLVAMQRYIEANFWCRVSSPRWRESTTVNT